MKCHVKFFLLGIYCAINMQAAEEGKYLTYENLPNKIFFTSFLEAFYIKPATDLGSQEALNYFLSSKVIRDALKSGEGVGSGLSMITISVPQSELKMFAKFTKNLGSGIPLTQSYQDAFGANDGMKILEDLQVNQEFLSEIKTALMMEEFASLQESKGQKRKREEESSKRTSEQLPKVIIELSKDKELELKPEQVKSLNDIKNSTIANLIEDTEDPILRLELPEQYGFLSDEFINQFLNIVIELYAGNLKPSDLMIWHKLIFALYQNKITKPQDIVRYVKSFGVLADWFGYDDFSKKVTTFAFLLSIPVVLNQKEEEIKSEDKKVKDIANKYKIQWSLKDISSVIEKIESVMKRNAALDQNTSKIGALKAILGDNKLVTLSDLGNVFNLKTKMLETSLISSVLGYKPLQNSSQSFYIILNLIEQLLALNALPPTTSASEMGLRAAQKRNLSLELKYQIIKYTDDLKEENRPAAMIYLNNILSVIPGVTAILTSLSSVH